MTTSLTTFDQRLRSTLVDVLGAQWRALGVPLSGSGSAASNAAHSNEVIDPEALLWCSLEFLPTEARLCEAVVSWLAENPKFLLRRRWNRTSRAGDPRRLLGADLLGTGKTPPEAPAARQPDPPSTRRLLEFRDRALPRVQPRLDWIGHPEEGNSTVLVRARQLLGDDARHLIIVYLLGTRGAAGLSEIAGWSRYSRRNLSEILGLLVAGGGLRKEHSRYRLSSLGAWEQLLGCQADALRIVDWHAAFEAIVGLLRTLERAREQQLPLDGVVLTTSRREAGEALRLAERADREDPESGLSRLRAAVEG